MKSALALIFAAAAGAAHASFDLVLVSDATNGVIHRYDAETGIYLGNFGNGLLVGAGALALDQATSTVYCLMDTGSSASNGVVSLNYNTGTVNYYALISTSFGGGIAVNSAGVFLSAAFGTTTGVLKFTALGTGTTNTQFTVGAGDASNFAASGVDSTGDVFAISNTLNKLFRWDSAVQNAPEGNVISSVFSNSVGMAIRGTELITVRTNGTIVRVGNTQSFSIATGASVSGWTNAVGSAFGHTTTAYAVGLNGTASKLQRYTRSAGGAGSTYEPVGPQMNLSQVGAPGGMAVVVAPEPASLAALMLGAGAFMRRRRR